MDAREDGVFCSYRPGADFLWNFGMLLDVVVDRLHFLVDFRHILSVFGTGVVEGLVCILLLFADRLELLNNFCSGEGNSELPCENCR